MEGELITALHTYSWINMVPGFICIPVELRTQLFYIMINSTIYTISEMFVTYFTFSGRLTAVINHRWHLLLHINVLEFHHWVPHSDWCSRLSPYPPHYSPAEYEMNRRSSPRLVVTQSCVSGQFSKYAFMTGSNKPVNAFTLNALFLLQSSPAL